MRCVPIAVSRPLCISWVCAPSGLCELSHPDTFSWLIISERERGRGAEPRPVSKLQQSIMQPYWFQDCVIYRNLPKEHTCGDLHLGVCLSLCTSARPRAVCLSFFFFFLRPISQLTYSSNIAVWSGGDHCSPAGCKSLFNFHAILWRDRSIYLFIIFILWIFVIFYRQMFHCGGKYSAITPELT